MRKGIFKIIVLTIIFFGAIAFFCITSNKGNEELTTELANATLPVLRLYTDNIEVNELHGYTTEMEGAFVRDTITPISENRILPAEISTYGNEIETISYEIRSPDGKRLVANAGIESFEDEGEHIKVSFPFSNRF